MTENIVFDWLIAFVEFFFGLAARIIGGFTTFGMLWAFTYIFMRYFVCKNDQEELGWLANELRTGLKDLAKAFRVAMPGVIQCAKEWVAGKTHD